MGVGNMGIPKIGMLKKWSEYLEFKKSVSYKNMKYFWKYTNRIFLEIVLIFGIQNIGNRQYIWNSKNWDIYYILK